MDDLFELFRQELRELLWSEAPQRIILLLGDTYGTLVTPSAISLANVYGSTPFLLAQEWANVLIKNGMCNVTHAESNGYLIISPCKERIYTALQKASSLIQCHTFTVREPSNSLFFLWFFQQRIHHLLDAQLTPPGHPLGEANYRLCWHLFLGTHILKQGNPYAITHWVQDCKIHFDEVFRQTGCPSATVLRVLLHLLAVSDGLISE